MDEEFGKAEPFGETIKRWDKEMNEGGLDVFEVNHIDPDLSVDMIYPEDFIKFAKSNQQPVFKEVTRPQKKHDYFTSDNILKVTGEPDINNLPDNVLDRITAYNKLVADVKWGEPDAVTYTTFIGSVAYQVFLTTTDYEKVDSGLQDFIATYEVAPEVGAASEFNDGDSFSPPPLEKQLQSDKLVDKFVEKVKTDPHLALTANVSERSKFVRQKAAADPELKKLLDKIDKINPLYFNAQALVSDALLTEMRNHKDHYDAIRKEMQGK